MSSQISSTAPFVDVDAGKRKKKLIIVGVVIAAGLTVGALAIGLGVGFGQKKTQETATATAPTPPAETETETTTKTESTPPAETKTKTAETETKTKTADTVTDVAVTGPGPTPNVRYIRIMRVEPSGQNENIINISELSVYGPGMKQLPLVDGTVHRLWANNPNYNWNQLKDSILVGFASTANDPDSRITADLGSAQTVHEIVVNNRTDAGTERIIGCELLLLDEKERVLRRWAFKDAGKAAKVYKVGVSTSMKLVAA